MIYETNPQAAHYIQNSKPNTDCVYCVVHHFLKADGITKDTEQYAECKCPEICKVYAAWLYPLHQVLSIARSIAKNANTIKGNTN